VADVFISYAKEDRAKAQELASFLSEQGRSVFWDRTIVPGEDFSIRIAAEIDAASCVLVLWSAHAIASNWVIDEADVALRMHKLVPALIEPVLPPMGLRRIQTADLSAVSWDRLAADPAATELLQTLNGLLGQRQLPPPLAAPPRSDPGLDHDERSALDQEGARSKRRRRRLVLGIVAASALVVVLAAVIVVATSPWSTDRQSATSSIDAPSSESLSSSISPAPSTAPPSPTNLLEDASFEDGSSWHPQHLPGSVHYTPREHSDARDGETVGEVTVSAAEGSIAQDQHDSVGAGDTFVFTAFVRSEGAGPVLGRIGIWVVDDETGHQEPPPFALEQLRLFTATDQWTEVTFTLTLQRDYTAPKIRAEIYVITTERALLVDEASLIRT
jgi:hypothetical protein